MAERSGEVHGLAPPESSAARHIVILAHDEPGSAGKAAESDEEDVTILKVTSVHGVDRMCICARQHAVSARII